MLIYAIFLWNNKFILYNRLLKGEIKEKTIDIGQLLLDRATNLVINTVFCYPFYNVECKTSRQRIVSALQ